MTTTYTRTISAICLVVSVLGSLFFAPSVFAAAPDAGGNTTVVNPSGEGAVSITEDAVQPESANIRLTVPTLSDPDGGTPSSIRIVTVTGGTLWQGGGSSITLGTSGTVLSLTSGKIDFRFRPDAGRDTDASFTYVVVDPSDSSVNSSASTATISITAVNDAPIMQTATGGTGIGLAATYYIGAWDLTGSTYQRIDATVDFSNNFSVPGLNTDNFSTRWSGKFKAPITGNITFSTVTDDGVRLWLDDELVIDDWELQAPTTNTAAPISVQANELYSIRMEFYERGGGEVAQLRWAYTGQSTQVVPQASLYPAVTRPELSFVNGAASVVIDDAITISDVDNATLASSTVTISENYQSGEDSLEFTDQNGITGQYADGVLTLTGTASLAHYQTALRSVRYVNSSDDPTTDSRTVEFVVNDGDDESNTTYRTIGFTDTNNAPVITQGASTLVTMDEDGSPTAFSLTLDATDADYHSITWSVSTPAEHGTATASGSGDSIAVGYTPTTNYNGSDSFVVQASDGVGGTDTITVNITITAQDPVATFSPADNATTVVVNTNLTLDFDTTITTSTGSILIKKSSDDATIETIDVAGNQITKSASDVVVINPSITLAESTGYYIIIPNTAFKDSLDDYYPGISSATTWNFTTGDFSGPVISAISATSTASTTASITWTTNENASSKVVYGLTAAYSAATAKTDTAPRVTNHAVNISDMLGCTTYHYAVVSDDASRNAATSTDQRFTTSGCVASSTPSQATSTSVTVASGGSSSLTQEDTTITVTTPEDFTDEALSVVIQIKAMASQAILSLLGRPDEVPREVGAIVFDVKAIINNTTILDSFDSPVTIEYQYTDADTEGLDESSFWLYHHHDGAWDALDDCSINMGTNTITCTAPNFSIFGLFGTPASTTVSARRGGVYAGPGAVPLGYEKPRPQTAYPDGSVVYEDGQHRPPLPSSPTVGSIVLADTFVPTVITEATTAACPQYRFTRALRFGMVGEDVRALQRTLNCLGFVLAENGPGSPGYETNLFVHRTHAAVIAFQQAYATDILAPLNLSKGTGIFAEFSRVKMHALLGVQ